MFRPKTPEQETLEEKATSPPADTTTNELEGDSLEAMPTTPEKEAKKEPEEVNTPKVQSLNSIRKKVRKERDETTQSPSVRRSSHRRTDYRWVSPKVKDRMKVSLRRLSVDPAALRQHLERYGNSEPRRSLMNTCLDEIRDEKPAVQEAIIDNPAPTNGKQN